MSLRFRTEQAFKALLEASGVAIEAGDLGPLQILTSQEASITVLSPDRVVIQALQGQQITPKSRNLRLRVLVHVETTADTDGDAASEDADAAALTIVHCQQVDRVAAILNNRNNLATELSRMGQANEGQFTCFGVVGEGEIFIKPEGAARVLRTTWAYTCTVAQQATT